ncbi:hypothetical protein QTH87_13445 [Variovorax sp. J22P168]|uniref:hypothetical protein n=1 Tax=Variovorax jilinensis TaxID=3053513 RepID=UPI002575630B|nr:hypothetical protein [Variovorax sp. J22P168]MDM0013441.1 hypothetical protein [Variovorax sp. J22P168]
MHTNHDDAAVDLKWESALCARAALRGIAVHRSTTDRGQPCWIASRWNLTKALGSLAELSAWVDRVGSDRS